MNLFKDRDGIVKAIEDGFVEESLRYRLKDLVESRQHGLKCVENVLPFQENGKKCWRKITINNCFDEEGNCSDYLVNIVDFSEMTDTFREMVYQMDYDGLTGIYNSEKFYREVGRLVTEYPEQEFAIIQLDFDRFKVIKDPAASNGVSSLQRCRAAGYLTLAAVAKWTCKHVRLARCPRE